MTPPASPNSKRIAEPDDDATALLKAVAMDIGKEVVAYVERMYPQAISAASGGFPLSLRNSIFNEIMAAMKLTDPDAIRSRLESRKRQRRKLKATVRNLNETDWEAARAKIASGELDVRDAIEPQDADWPE